MKIIASILILFTACSHLFATLYYVATNGSDSNNGTSTATPFQTIQKGVDMAGPGDRIYVKAGNYAPITINNKIGTNTAPISINSYYGDEQKVIITTGTRYGGSRGITMANCAYYWIRDIRISNIAAGINIKASNHITLINVSVDLLGNEGIAVQQNSEWVTIDHCYIAYTGAQNPPYGEGIYIGTGSTSMFWPDTTKNVKITNGTIVRDTSAEGINIKGEAFYVTVENCLIANYCEIGINLEMTNDPVYQYQPTVNRGHVIQNTEIRDSRSYGIKNFGVGANIHDNNIHNNTDSGYLHNNLWSGVNQHVDLVNNYVRYNNSPYQIRIYDPNANVFQSGNITQ